MSVLRLRIRVGLLFLGVVMVAAWVHISRNPYARLEFTGKAALALGPGGSLQTISRIAAVIHCADPGVYFSREADQEKQALLATGHLVETRITISEARTSRSALTALWYRYRQTGAYWSARVDKTNHVVLLISKPEDVASFAAALDESGR